LSLYFARNWNLREMKSLRARAKLCVYAAHECQRRLAKQLRERSYLHATARSESQMQAGIYARFNDGPWD
jgi:hypothetical protein